MPGDREPTVPDAADVMSDEPAQPKSEADANLEREVRKDRKFSLAEAIGRLAGPGAMKGASPIPRKQQVEIEIDEFLRRELADDTGALRTVIYRGVKESEQLINNYDRPQAVLAAFLRSVLDSEHRLKDLVREADVEWGRILDERPHFEQDGSPPHPDDPYTLRSVRQTISQLIEKLSRSCG